MKISPYHQRLPGWHDRPGRPGQRLAGEIAHPVVSHPLDESLATSLELAAYKFAIRMGLTMALGIRSVAVTSGH